MRNPSKSILGYIFRQAATVVHCQQQIRNHRGFQPGIAGVWGLNEQAAPHLRLLMASSQRAFHASKKPRCEHRHLRQTVTAATHLYFDWTEQARSVPALGCDELHRIGASLVH